MIKITRPPSIPKILSVRGGEEDKKNRIAYDLDALNYQTGGTSKFDILNKIYGHKTVKSVLKIAQHNKCCFCERDQGQENGAVEHYRPKNGYKKIRKDKLSKPGYYWVGYNWENLLFVCSLCNGAKYKGNLFPLVDESKRATSHYDDIANEDPLLINPSLVDPKAHIYFKGQLVYGKTTYGTETIAICGLDREALNDYRAELIEKIDFALSILGSKDYHTPDQTKKAKGFLQRCVKPEAPFSATAIDYLKNFTSQPSLIQMIFQ